VAHPRPGLIRTQFFVQGVVCLFCSGARIVQSQLLLVKWDVRLCCHG